jgi:hypothetical protein
MPETSDPAYAKKMIPLEANHVKQGIIKELSSAKKLSGILLTGPRCRVRVLAIA